MEELEAEQKMLLVKLGEQGQSLSSQRRAAALTLEKSIETELGDLHMSGARFKWISAATGSKRRKPARWRASGLLSEWAGTD